MSIRGVNSGCQFGVLIRGRQKNLVCGVGNNFGRAIELIAICLANSYSLVRRARITVREKTDGRLNFELFLARRPSLRSQKQLEKYVSVAVFCEIGVRIVNCDGRKLSWVHVG